MSPEEFHDFRTSLNISLEKRRKVLTEYYYLSKLETLTEHQAERMGNILQMAEFDDYMAILINEVDEITFQELGFYGGESLEHHANEVAMSQEYVLSEDERNFLMSFSVIGQSVRYGHQNTRAPFKKVEMLYDPTQSQRYALDRIFLLEHLPGEVGANSIYMAGSGISKGQQFFAQFKNLFRRFVIDEMISWIMSAALIGMIVLMI